MNTVVTMSYQTASKVAALLREGNTQIRFVLPFSNGKGSLLVFNAPDGTSHIGWMDANANIVFGFTIHSRLDALSYADAFKGASDQVRADLMRKVPLRAPELEILVADLV